MKVTCKDCLKFRRAGGKDIPYCAGCWKFRVNLTKGLFRERDVLAAAKAIEERNKKLRKAT